MDKEFLEMLKSLNGVLEDMLGDSENSFTNKMKKRINEGFNEKASLSIEKFEDGRAETHIEGSNIGVLIALAGLEKSVLEKLDVPKGVWELIKHSVGTKEAE
mgnify:CR=1 FL=1